MRLRPPSFFVAGLVPLGLAPPPRSRPRRLRCPARGIVVDEQGQPVVDVDIEIQFWAA
jgi:hypothetical protein